MRRIKVIAKSLELLEIGYHAFGPITVAIWHNTVGFIAFSSLLFFDFTKFKIFNFDTILLLVLLGIFGSFLQILEHSCVML